MAGQYGQFTGYEPLPDVPGAYNFQLANGGQRTFVGPEAEALRAKIDAVPDQRTAGVDWKQAAIGAANAFLPGAGLASLAASDADAKGKADVPVSAAPAAAPRAAPAAAAVQAGPVAATQPAAATTPAGGGRYQLLTTEKDGSQIFLKPGGDPRNPMDLVKETPGSRGSKGGLALRAVTTQDGYELDPKRLAELQESQDEIQTAARRSAIEAKKAADERQAFFTAARQQASSEVVQAAREKSLVDQGVADIRARYDAAEKDFLEAPEKQKSAREGNKGKTFVEAIAMSLGALGAAMARTPNFAAQTIEANRERELRREEAELRVKKDAKDSLYGRLRDEMGSAELARTAWRAIRTKQDMLALEQVAAKSSDLKLQQEILQVAAGQNQGFLKYMEDLERGAQGKVSKQLVNVPGSSGSAPRRVGVSLEEAAKLGNIAQTAASTDKTRVETEKAATETKSGGKLSDTAANTLSNIDASLNLLPGVAESSKKAGRMVVPDVEVAGFSAAGKESTDYRAKARGLIRIAAKAVEGDAAAESHIQALEDGLMSGDPAKRAAAQVELARTLQQKRKTMENVVPGAAPK